MSSLHLSAAKVNFFCSWTECQLLPANRVSRFYESNEYYSLSQIIKIIGKYICNSFAFSRIKFTFAMDPH